MRHLQHLIIGSALGLIALTGSAIKTTANTFSNNSYVQVVKVQSELPPGAVIGKRKCSDGGLELFKPTCGEITINGLSESAAQGYIKVIESQLNQAGYQVLGMAGQTSVFGNYMAQPNQTPDYLIGVTITGAEIDSKQGLNAFTNSYSWKTLGKVSTRWEVFDTKQRKVIFSKKITSEKIKVSGESIAPLVQQAIQEATNDFFSQSEVQTILK